MEEGDGLGTHVRCPALLLIQTLCRVRVAGAPSQAPEVRPFVLTTLVFHFDPRTTRTWVKGRNVSVTLQTCKGLAPPLNPALLPFSLCKDAPKVHHTHDV